MNKYKPGPGGKGDPERNLALSALDAEAQAKDLLKPTEVDVAEATKYLRGLGNPYGIQIAGYLETLLAENEALRDNPPIYLNLENGNILNVYNPDTHVAVPREPTEAMVKAALGASPDMARITYRAMLTAAQEGE